MQPTLNSDDIMKLAATVLIVEDDRSMLHGMRDLLQSVDIGYELRVLTASDGLMALELMSDETPDLIVSDIMMPNMDGYQLLERVRENPYWMHLPFIFLTAKGDKRDVFEGRKSAANLYIVKPFGTAELLELIESQLSKYFRSQAALQTGVETLKKSILQVLNHEFRTPLTYVNAYYEMLAEGVGRLSEDQNLQEYLRGIQAGSVRLASLVDDLIQVIELRTGETEADFLEHAVKLDQVDDILATAVAGAQPIAEREGVQLRFEVQQELPPVFGHAPSLSNALNRLLANAIKFTRHRSLEEALVLVMAGVANGELHISVKDTGSGFPQKVQSQIFDLFFQYNRGLLEQQGAGVGLTIAEGLVALHNGRIDVQSQEGVGSEFTMVLPTMSGDIVRLGRHREGLRIANILVVEDDPFLLDGLRELLEITTGKYRYRVLTASNGEEGLQLLAGTQPDLIISDIMMPRMGGYELLKEVRANPAWFQIPFVFLTARGALREIHKGLVSGAEEYITKPYQSEELLELISTQLDRYFQLQGVVAQSFDVLKRSILDLITPEFRLPLSSVSRFSERLADGFRKAKNEQDLKQSLTGIHEGSVRLTRLVEDFITLAELKTGEAEATYELRAQPIGNLGALLCETGRLIRSGAGMDHLRIHCCVPEQVPAVFGNSKGIMDSVQRLVEATYPHLSVACHELFLSLTASEDELLIEIRYPIVPDRQIIPLMRGVFGSSDSEAPESAYLEPGLSIAKGLLDLNSGKIEMLIDEKLGWFFNISLPTYNPPRPV
jgi:DNA-binding response OmpR family regulator/two-component sensor histidine kinase